MKHWKPDEAVDGAGNPLPLHAEVLAKVLALTPVQAAILVAELRNALVPGYTDPAIAQKCIERILTLASAIAKLSRE